MADKALVLGINSYKTVSSLRGCVTDTETIKAMLVEVFTFPEKNVRALTNEQVVKPEVKKQLAWLFQGAKPGDRVVLHFSGHGSYVADKDGDEDDGRDELIALYDMDFDDPNSYLLDDELRAWTDTKPKGVELTIVLDNCNSGTGTRMLLAARPGGAESRAEVDTTATVKRTMAGKTTSRGLDTAAAVARAIKPDSEDVILVRDIDPPQAVKDEVEAAKSRRVGKRGFVKVKTLNHLLLTACRADQTAADANIDGKPCGAFSYYLNRALRNGGASMDRRALIEKVAAALQDGQFSQVPQMEGASDDGPLFAPNDDVSDPDPAPSKPTSNAAHNGAATVPSTFLEFVEKLAPLDPESRKRVLDIYEKGYGATGSAGRALAQRDLVAQRFLVTVHGICKHPAGYSDEWWNSLHPFTKEFGDGVLGDSRREVLWSDLVNERGLLPAGRGIDDERSRLAFEIRETLQDRIDRQAIESMPRSGPDQMPRSLEDTRALINIPGINCVDDFVVYMTDDGVRRKSWRGLRTWCGRFSRGARKST